MDENTMAVALMGQLCGTILLVSIIFAIVRRRRQPPPSDGLQRVELRLTEMQQALDAVAVEVERISEGQRFATRLLSERTGAPVPESNGVPEAVRRNSVR